jgi:xanthine dehydrogenase accessory factor
MPTPHGFIEKLAELSRGGGPFVSVTMVDAIGSTPNDAGTKMLVDLSGLLFGTVGGGRVENQAIDFAQRMLREKDAPTSQLVEWNLQRDVGMTCGGVVKLYFEAYNHRAWRIVIFGAGHVAQSLVRCLSELDCQIICIDPRADWIAKLPQSGKLTTIRTDDMPAEVAKLDESDFVICITMGHRTDRPILEALFRRGVQPAYLGVIGSEAKRKVLLRELSEAGFSAEVANRFRCPIGLPIGQNQPGEIAISVAAELIQVRDELAALAR